MRNLIGDLAPEDIGFSEALYRSGGEESCDFCVIGSGAGGAPIAAHLARAGHSVVILEEGPAIRGGQFQSTLWSTTKLIFRDLSLQLAVGRSMTPILQGCCVGGTTTINSAICWRLPDAVWGEWKKTLGPRSPLTDGMLTRAFDRLESELHIRPTAPEVMGRNNQLMERACRKLGIPGHVIERNEHGCEGLGMCIHGCPKGKKLSMETSYIPEAINHGARLFPLCRAEAIITAKGRATGVRGSFIDPRTKARGAALTVFARKGVILAAGAVHSPLILRKSGVRHAAVGANFMCHPGVGVAARFPEDIRMWEGTTQAYETTHYRPRGYKIEGLSLPPEMLMLRLPGVGRRWTQKLAEMDKIAMWAVALKAEARGRVTRGLLGPRIAYSLTRKDARTMLEGVKTLGKMFFAAGADALYTGVYGMPEIVTREEDLQILDSIPEDPRRLLAVATHLFGTCGMGEDRATSVIGPNFECHDLPGVFVTDGSALPTNTGVNPQLTIMAFSLMAGELLSGR